MPLKQGYSKPSIGDNLKKLRSEGYEERQSRAIALSQARRAAKKAGKPEAGPPSPPPRRSSY